MCGIAGVFHPDGRPVPVGLLRRMADVQRHRGPDAEGFWSGGFVGFAHRRLAVIDLTPGGHQPMASDDGEQVIVYNGEVYNFRELRSELEERGVAFRSASDTEVVLKAWRELGESCLHRFNGMFAFALWDNRSNELFLARDRYGIKPLYYWFDGTTFLFASEIKALLQHPAVAVEVDLPALLEYFTFQNIFTDRTRFGGVHLLPPGCSLTVRLGSTAPLAARRWWDWEFREPDKPLPMRDYLEELDRLFRQAVTRQLVSDVPVGAYLSGGMDSGAITSIAATHIPNLSSFTVGFDLSSASGLELAFDERRKAEHLSYLYKTEHYEVVLKAGDMERVMPSLIWHLEDPRVGQCYPNYFVARLASKFVKVVLSGAGGDELFAGYPWRYYRAVVNDDFEQYIQKYYVFWQRLLPNRFMPRLFRPEIWEQLKDRLTIDVFRGVMRGEEGPVHSPEDYVNRSLSFEARTFLHGLFVVEDKLSMAHGLETRVPFLDNDLVDFALRVPVKHKLRNLTGVVRLNENEPGIKTQRYFRMTRDGKIILRKMLANYVPPKIAAQQKQGFSAPDAGWFRGESLHYLQGLLLDPGARINDYFQPEFTAEVLHEHTSGRTNRRLLLWSLLCFEWWLRTFKGGEGRD